VFVAFIVSHTIHFICVTLLIVATRGGRIDARAADALLVAAGLLFYLACAAVLHVKRRPASGWPRPSDRRIEVWTLTAIWLAFFQAYVSRPLQWWLFPALAIVLLYALARFVSASLRSRDFPIPMRTP
jgi:ABC-type dipeptide/oligopeptide/nickel transport system permease subunit